MSDKRRGYKYSSLALVLALFILLPGCNGKINNPDTIPDTTITAAPNDPANVSFAIFAFTCDQSSCQFQCKMDSSRWSGCNSPKSYQNLSDGIHTFEVKAIMHGVEDPTPATFTWTIDTKPPDTILTKTPPTLTNNPNADFEFACDSGVCEFQCQLDSSGWQDCSSPQSFLSLPDGTHVFEVRSIDLAGNIDPTPASFTWTIDTTPPDTFITNQPPSLTNATGAIFEFSCTDASLPCTFECQLDGAGWNSCSSGITYSSLSDGIHNFEVRASDAAGNIDPTPASFNWAIDTTPPDTTISAHPPNPNFSTAASFSFICNESSCIFECNLDSAGWSGCSSPQNYCGLSGGSHTFEVRAIDAAGNVDSTPASFSWGIVRASAVSAGWNHTCAVTSTGGVKCWGANYSGQLANRTTANSNIPLDVSSLASGIIGISAGYTDNCVLTSSGGVKCWGPNNWGELGNGTTVKSNVPVNVSGLASGVRAISAGLNFACALTSSGGAKCWGYNGYGELGNGSTVSSSVPVNVSYLSSGVRVISAGGFHSCAVTSTGAAKCWGFNAAGQVGNGTIVWYNTFPVNVSGLSSGVIDISAGYNHTCAVTSSGGGVKCWGLNNFGQLGNGTVRDSNVPVDVIGLAPGASAISARNDYSCALTSWGLQCWGDNNDGELGVAIIGFSSVPLDVTGLSSGISAISAGGYHACALTSSGGVKCWGWNGYGELGNGTNTSSNVPVDVFGFGP